MSLTKEAIELLTQVGIKPHEHIVELEDGTTWQVDNDGNVSQLMAQTAGTAKRALTVHTLTGLVDYIKSNRERKDKKMYLHIRDSEYVTLQGLLLEDGKREELLTAEARIPKFFFDSYYPSEDFLIGLNARIVDAHDRKQLIAFAGNVKEDNARQTSDDGFAQKTTVKRGISQAGEEIVPNPVTLAPYRTFTEVDQPESEFIFRMKEGPQFALFEADGGAWQNQAIFNIKAFLEDELKDEIKNERITILA